LTLVDIRPLAHLMVRTEGMVSHWQSGALGRARNSDYPAMMGFSHNVELKIYFKAHRIDEFWMGIVFQMRSSHNRVRQHPQESDYRYKRCEIM